MSDENVAISADLNVADLLARWPQAIQWFLSHQMSCVGCSMASFDTLEEVAVNYGIPLSEVISGLRQAIASPPG